VREVHAVGRIEFAAVDAGEKLIAVASADKIAFINRTTGEITVAEHPRMRICALEWLEKGLAVVNLVDGAFRLELLQITENNLTLAAEIALPGEPLAIGSLLSGELAVAFPDAVVYVDSAFVGHTARVNGARSVQPSTVSQTVYALNGERQLLSISFNGRDPTVVLLCEGVDHFFISEKHSLVFVQRGKAVLVAPVCDPQFAEFCTTEGLVI
jgi:hypothetical protein